MEYNNDLDNQRNKRHSLLVWFFVIIIIVSIPPFYFWRYSFVVSIITSCGFLFYGLWKIPYNPYRRLSIALFFMFYLYSSFNIYAELNLVGSLWNGFRLFITFTIFFISDENWPVIYKNFLAVYTIILIPSLFVYFCAIWIGIDLPHTVISPLNELKDYSYQAYPFMVIKDDLDSFRFCGYFDEPGVIGNISGVLLVVNRCNMRDWRNWVLLISGIFSFSLFFYGIVSLFVLLFGSKKIKIVLIILVVIAIAYLGSSDNVFSNLILSRLEMGDDGEFVGDNRTHESFDVFYNKFLSSDMLWLGYGYRYCNLVADTGGQSYKHLIVDHGIIMSSLYVIAFILYYLSYNIKRRHFAFLLMVLFSILFQRPFISYYVYLFLMISPAVMVKYMFEKDSITLEQ